MTRSKTRFSDKEGFFANKLVFEQDIAKTSSFKNSFAIRKKILQKDELDIGKTSSFKRGLAIRTGLITKSAETTRNRVPKRYGR